MDVIRTLALASAVVCCVHASAAVTMPPGVDLPPRPRATISPNPSYWQGGSSLPAYVIQTTAGAVECPQRWFDASECRAYLPGQDRRPRAFVRRVGQWVVCSRPQGTQGCVGIKDLPNMIEQD